MSCDNVTDRFILNACSRMLIETYGIVHYVDVLYYASWKEHAVDLLDHLGDLLVIWVAMTLMWDRNGRGCFCWLACRLIAWFYFRKCVFSWNIGPSMWHGPYTYLVTGLLKYIEIFPVVYLWQNHIFLAANKQLYKWYFPSVCLSVRPSVRLSVRPSVTPFWLCSHHRIIMKFSGVITSDRSDVHAKGQGQRSKVKVTEVTTQLNRFRTVTPVWIHIWWWNDAYSLIMLRRGALLFFKVIRQISRSHGSKNLQIWPRLGVSGL